MKFEKPTHQPENTGTGLSPEALRALGSLSASKIDAFITAEAENTNKDPWSQHAVSIERSISATRDALHSMNLTDHTSSVEAQIRQHMTPDMALLLGLMDGAETEVEPIACPPVSFDYIISAYLSTRGHAELHMDSNLEHFNDVNVGHDEWAAGFVVPNEGNRWSLQGSKLLGFRNYKATAERWFPRLQVRLLSPREFILRTLHQVYKSYLTEAGDETIFPQCIRSDYSRGRIHYYALTAKFESGANICTKSQGPFDSANVDYNDHDIPYHVVVSLRPEHLS